MVSDQSPEQIERQIKHQAYLDSLRIPTLAQVEAIAEVQEQKEKKVQKVYDSTQENERTKAANTIQRNYRGYKTRRELAGFGLDPSTRWVEAIREAQYRNLTRPRPKAPEEAASKADDGNPPLDAAKSLRARNNWHHVSGIAQHAHGAMPEHHEEDIPDSKEQSRLWHRKPDHWHGKMMDLPYFLEMVDQKHRYGSNLRAYHAEWKKSDTHENYFYWLDYGEGRDVELSTVSRARLEREQVRYLSREERMQYLVVVDQEGRLCWAKNGQRINTSTEFRDSIKGIVPVDSPAKTFRQDELKKLNEGAAVEQRKGPSLVVQDRDPTANTTSSSSSSSFSGSISSGSTSSSASSIRYPDPPALSESHGLSKLKHVSAGVILNRLLRKSTKKNTWIFVADTNMHLYVGIKQSGSFQHSSFINGARISAAGLIKIKNGQLRSLSPLSGHYRPPAAAFRHFITHLKAEGVDMSRVSISRAYAVLVGLEAYLGSKQRISKGGEKVKHGVERVIAPEKADARKELEKDKSQSARLEEQAERVRWEQEHRHTAATVGLNRVIKGVRERMGSGGRREREVDDQRENI